MAIFQYMYKKTYLYEYFCVYLCVLVSRLIETTVFESLYSFLVEDPWLHLCSFFQNLFHENCVYQAMLFSPSICSSYDFVDTPTLEDIQEYYNLKNTPQKVIEADDENAVSKFKKEFHKKVGVYLIIHKKTKMVYIGSTVQMHLRPFEHLNLKPKASKNVRKIVKEETVSSFVVVALEVLGEKKQFKPEKTVEMIEKIREQYYLDTIPKHQQLNICTSRFGGDGGTEEQKAKFSKMFSGTKNPFWGKKHSLEVLSYLSEQRLGEKNPMYGKPKSKEFLESQKIFRFKKGKKNYSSKPIELTNIETGEVHEFPTQTSRGRFLGYADHQMVRRHQKKGCLISIKDAKKPVWKISQKEMKLDSQFY